MSYNYFIKNKNIVGFVMNKDRVDYFSKSDSFMLKGIGIILMICYHLFRDADVCFSGKTVDFFPFSFEQGIAINDSFRICVSLFVFVTGFGLFKAYEKSLNVKTEKWIIERLVKTMNGFYFIYLLLVPVFQFVDKLPENIYCKDGNIRGAIYALIDFLGLSNLFSTPSLQGAWWYMSAAIVFIIFTPTLYQITNKFGFTKVLVFVIIIPRIFKIGYLTGCNVYTFLPIFLVGMFFAKYDVFRKINENNPFRKNYVTKVLEFILFVTLIFLSALCANRVPRSKLWELHFCIVPILVIVFSVNYVSKVKFLKRILAFLGKYSMNMFLVHSFIRVNYFYDFTYSFKYAVVIAVVLIGLSLLASIVIELIKKIIRYDKLVDKIILKIEQI